MDHTAAVALIRALQRTSRGDLGLKSTNVAASIAKTRGPPFRFVDLPAEIRNNIYRIVVRGSGALRIRNFNPPAITRASKQLRAESLPVFFDVNTFVAEIKTKWTLTLDRYAPGTLSLLPWIGVFFLSAHKRYKQVGTLKLRQETISYFKRAGAGTARIKNLDVCVLEAVEAYPNGFRYLDVIISMRSEEGRPGSATVSVYISEQNARYTEEVMKDLRHITTTVKAVLETAIAKPDFNGLSVAELKRVANAFRVEARVASNVARG
ncbi:hypothetical protein LTR85_009913 [Meristemomyces frigidus]|nr:hypothetical protein LTR85_009913 [Meristemomyces frigidus]